MPFSELRGQLFHLIADPTPVSINKNGIDKNIIEFILKILDYCDRLTRPANAYPLACETSLCVRGTQVYVSCQPGYQPGLAQTITCVQALGRSAWSAQPSCVTQGSLGIGGLSSLFSSLFGKGKKK